MHKHDTNSTPICRPFRSLVLALPLFHHRSNAVSLAATARFHPFRLLFLLDLYRSSHGSTSHQTPNEKADLSRLTLSRFRYSSLLCFSYFREKSFLAIETWRLKTFKNVYLKSIFTLCMSTLFLILLPFVTRTYIIIAFT